MCVCVCARVRLPVHALHFGTLASSSRENSVTTGLPQSAKRGTPLSTQHLADQIQVQLSFSLAVLNVQLYCVYAGMHRWAKLFFFFF